MSRRQQFYHGCRRLVFGWERLTTDKSISPTINFFQKNSCFIITRESFLLVIIDLNSTKFAVFSIPVLGSPQENWVILEFSCISMTYTFRFQSIMSSIKINFAGFFFTESSRKNITSRNIPETHDSVFKLHKY